VLQKDAFFKTAPLFDEICKKREKLISSEPGFAVFREAVSAIDRPALSWLEGDFALFSTV